jgi:putative endonuclease
VDTENGKNMPAGTGTIWFVYLLECRNGAIYTGIAIDVDQRFAAHAAGRGARYTRANPPVRVLARFAYADRSSATKAEAAIKRLDARAKRALASGRV